MKQRHVHSLFQRLLLTLIILVLLISSIFFISLLNSSALQDLKASSFNLFDQRVMYRSDAIQKNLNERCLDTDDVATVSYTHLDVYKRQHPELPLPQTHLVHKR